MEPATSDKPDSTPESSLTSTNEQTPPKQRKKRFYWQESTGELRDEETNVLRAQIISVDVLGNSTGATIYHSIILVPVFVDAIEAERILRENDLEPPATSSAIPSQSEFNETLFNKRPYNSRRECIASVEEFVLGCGVDIINPQVIKKLTAEQRAQADRANKEYGMIFYPEEHFANASPKESDVN